jgi:hypothetical protein
MGVLQKKRDGDGKWERTKMKVPCTGQTWDYCNTFHLIDKGNGVGANYDLGGKSRLDNWAPKLIFWLYNMALNNTYSMYKALVKQHTPERTFLDTTDTMREFTYGQEAEGRASELWTRGMLKLFGWITGRKVCSDTNGMMMVQLVMPTMQVPMDNCA